MNKKIDYVIKVGGSLIENEPKFNALSKKIIDLGKKSNIIVTTGSKNLSDVMMDYIKNTVKYELTGSTRFDLIMKARDSMARLFSDSDAAYMPVETKDALSMALNDGHIPVLVQYNMLKEYKPFQFGRGLSTDTTSAYFSKIFNAGKLIKFTNVDGVYRNFGEPNQSLIKKIHSSELIGMGETCIDEKFAKYLLKENLSCFVMNGYNITNFDNFINDQEAICTKIYS